VTLVSGGFKACAVAKADPTLNVLREWAFAVSGFGFDGSVIAPTPETSSGLSFTPSCVYVFKGSAPGGQFAATVTYGGAGVDAVLVLAGTGTWGPLGDHVSGMERP
jgi:hypothetical protein